MHPMNLLWYLVPHIAFSIAEYASAQLNITRVAHDTFAVLGIKKSVFSVQDALFPDSLQSALYEEFASNNDTRTYIFADACQQANTAPNCTTSCKDPSLLFSNLETLHNCMVFPKVAAHYYENNLTDNARALVVELGIEPSKNDSESNQKVTDLIQTCLTDYCTSIKGCRGYYDSFYEGENANATAYKDKSNWDFAGEGSYLVESICDSLKFQSQVNPDIGGIGVYVSYWIQTGMALLGFIATMLCNSWIYHIYHAALTIKHGFEKAQKKAQWIRNGNQKHLSRLAVALTDFQKAQCFFMVAINVAAQVVIWQGGLQPNSLQQIYNTYVFIKVLAISGYLPITFTLFTLHMIGMVSWYLLALSVSSVALSVATLVTIGDFEPSTADLNDLASSFAAGGPESCANVQLGAFCYVPFDNQFYATDSAIDPAQIGDAAFRMLAFCLVVLLLLVFEKAKVLQWPKIQRLLRWLSQKLSPCLVMFASLAGYIRNALERLVTQRMTRWINALVRAIHINHTANDTGLFWQCFVALLYTLFSCLYIYWFSIYSRLLGWFATNQSYSTSWNFGQIVAITVWAPPLCEYIHLELRGMRRGFDHKLLPPYRITKDYSSPNVEPKPEDSMPLVAYAGQPEKGDYGSLENPESPEYQRPYSEDHLKWHLPGTV